MKIRLLSDLHCEGFPYTYKPLGEDVLVLAGDIHTRNRHEELITQVPPHVQIIMVAGNHEYYRGIVEDVDKYLKGLEEQYPNFKFLNNDSFTFQGVEFFGGTMFTDFSLYGLDVATGAQLMSERGISDFHVIRKMQGPSVRMWTTEDQVDHHNNFRRELKSWIESTTGQKRVVVSHFVPSKQAIHPRWNGSLLNPYFTVDMEDCMGWDGLWLYGHTHDSSDFIVGETRVVGNPKGYGSENFDGFNEELILEI